MAIISTQKRHFSSGIEFANFVESGYADSKFGRSYGREIVAGIASMRNGYNDQNTEVERQIRTFENEVQQDSPVWETNVYGQLANVPAFLAGVPDSMWNRTTEIVDRTPIRIWVGVTSSGAISERDLEKRGACIGAFASAMVKIRPVIISPYVVLGLRLSDRTGNRIGAIASWDLQTSPFELGSIMASLACPKVTRSAGISACEILEPRCDGGWHPDYADEALMRAHLGARPNDVYLASIHLHDALLADPTAWLKKTLAKYRDEE